MAGFDIFRVPSAPIRTAVADVFRLRHVSDSFFVQLGHFFRYAKHFDFARLRWCPNSAPAPQLEHLLTGLGYRTVRTGPAQVAEELGSTYLGAQTP